MTILVLCNVGNRDLILEGEVSPPHPAREEGRRLLDEYPTVAARLTFPIIEPCLRYVVAQHSGGIDRLVLYGTDQEGSAYRANDTLHFAELGARRLPVLLGDALRGAVWQPVRGINPALYDEAFEKFDELLTDLSYGAVDACYVVITGGIPACNTALLFQGVRHFGDRLRVVYLPQGGEPQELRAGQQVMDAFREAAAVEHLQRLDFANALPRLERLRVDRGLVGLVTYAAQRFAFDFHSAQDTLLHALRDGDRSVRAFIHQRLRHNLDPLLAQDGGRERLSALLRELYWNAAIIYRHRRYADFLGRVYRFQEAVLRYLVETVFDLPTDLGPQVRKANQRLWSEGIRANPGLVAFLAMREVEGKPLDWEMIGRPTYKALMSYATNEAEGLDAEAKLLLSPGERKKYTALLSRVNKLDPLVELRHRTIIGHDFEGVSEPLLLENYKGGQKPDGMPRTPVEGLREIMGMLGIHVQDDPYQAVAEFVIHNLRRG
ncbi:MAG: hypothetical protein SWK90_17275 [Chloroflexota bacterium]|nr:hypothetical protein [Chloroflexota bacterium]